MADYRVVQKQTASLTYIPDGTNRFKLAYPGSIPTISSVVCSVQPSPAVVSAVAVATASGGAANSAFTFHLATSGATTVPGPDLLATFAMTLSNGDVDVVTVGVSVVNS